MWTTALWTYRLVVAAAVGAMVYDFYLAEALGYRFDDTMRWGVLAAAAAEPVFWAVTHLFGGVLMGVAAGGIWDGMKLSLILGTGLGVSRAWPYVAGAAAGAYAANGPLLYSVGGMVLAVLLFGLDRAMTWMWHHARPDHLSN